MISPADALRLRLLIWEWYNDAPMTILSNHINDLINKLGLEPAGSKPETRECSFPTCSNVPIRGSCCCKLHWSFKRRDK